MVRKDSLSSFYFMKQFDFPLTVYLTVNCVFRFTNVSPLRRKSRDVLSQHQWRMFLHDFHRKLLQVLLTTKCEWNLTVLLADFWGIIEQHKNTECNNCFNLSILWSKQEEEEEGEEKEGDDDDDDDDDDDPSSSHRGISRSFRAC